MLEVLQAMAWRVARRKYWTWAMSTIRPGPRRTETRETAERELEVARARGEALQSLEHDRNALMESYAGMVRETLEELAPEESHRI